VQRISARRKPAIEGEDEVERSSRRFGRLRSATEAVPPEAGLDGHATLAPPTPLPMSEAPEPLVLPLDSTKTFVGPNGTYYDERWRLMEWQGSDRSWNWSAALTFGGWLAYRRLYGLATVYLGWVAGLLLLLLHDAPVRLVALAQLGVAITVGLYGNRLYMAQFRRAAWRVARRHDEHAARLHALASQGGVDRRAVWVMALAGIGLAGLLIGLDS
jgi:Protein of unknown function (DUF2628)